MKKYLSNERGYTLIIALLAITVLTVLGLSVMAVTGASKKNVDREEKNQSAYYIAEAGLNQKKVELQKIETLFTTFQAQQKENEKNEAIPKMTSDAFIAAFKAYADTELKEVVKPTNYVSKLTQCATGVVCKQTLELSTAKAVVDTAVDITNTNFDYTITSTGYVDNQKRKIRSTLSYNLEAKAYKEATKSFSQYAIHATDTLTIDKGTVTGALGFTSRPTTNTGKKFPFGNEQPSMASIHAPSGKIYESCQSNCTNSYLKEAEEKKDIVFNDTNLPILPVFPENEFPNENATFWSGVKPAGAKLLLPTNTNTLNGDYFIDSSNDTNRKHTLNIGSNTVNLYFPNGFNLANDNSPWEISGNGTINIYASSFVLKKSMDFHNNNVNIISNTTFTMENFATLKAKNLLIKSSQLKINNSSISTTENIKMYANKELILEGDKPLTSLQTDIYYKGTTQAQIRNKFNNKFNFESLYSGFSINDYAAIIGNITVHGKEHADCNADCRMIYFNDSADLTTPIYVNAPNSNIKFRNVNLQGSFIGKKVEVAEGSNITFAHKTMTPSSPGSSSPELEETTGTGIITSSFTNKTTGGSIEID